MIKIICVGKNKRDGIQSEIDFYLKQLRNEVVIIEVKDGSDKTFINAEGEQIMKHILPKDYVFSLVVDGKKQYNSNDFSKIIEKNIGIYNNICFIIGGSFGLSNDVIKKSNELISFGKLTMPHLLCRLVLVEQIYRAKQIIKNHPYHK